MSINLVKNFVYDRYIVEEYSPTPSPTPSPTSSTPIIVNHFTFFLTRYFSDDRTDKMRAHIRLMLGSKGEYLTVGIIRFFENDVVLPKDEAVGLHGWLAGGYGIKYEIQLNFHIVRFSDIIDVLRSDKSRLVFVLGTGHGELQFFYGSEPFPVRTYLD